MSLHYKCLPAPHSTSSASVSIELGACWIHLIMFFYNVKENSAAMGADDWEVSQFNAGCLSTVCAKYKYISQH